jgi:hypothetical protein
VNLVRCQWSMVSWLLMVGFVLAENIDLSTVPARDTVQLTIYNSEDLTLVRETRQVTFKKGANPLQFSWAGTLIDPSSVQLRFLTQPDQLTVLDTTFPHDKPQMLRWNVASELDGAATIEITYFTSGITWSADYVCVADAEEARARLEGFVRIHNGSGEQYENAQVRLVVGTINLVEKIAQLANIPVSDVGRMDADRLSGLRRKSLEDAIVTAGAMAPPMPADAAAPAPKEIVKEGLSEYFIFTIEGTETIPSGWSKRLRSVEASEVPLKIQYRYRPVEYGEQLVRMYLMTNDEKSKLGDSPLPDGVVRVFRDNGRDGLSFLAQQSIKYIPIGDKIELNLGPDPEVIFELIKLRSFRDNLWLNVGARLLRKVGEGAVIRQDAGQVVGWDEHEIYTQRIRNYTAKPIEVEIRRAFPGHVIFKSRLAAKLFDFQTVELTTPVAAGKKADLLFEVVRKQGTSAKQSNVTLEAADVAP